MRLLFGHVLNHVCVLGFIHSNESSEETSFMYEWQLQHLKVVKKKRKTLLNNSKCLLTDWNSKKITRLSIRVRLARSYFHDHVLSVKSWDSVEIGN